MSNPYIATQTGRLDFLDPKPEQIHIEDIAHSLSMQCRFNGHVDRFYSVAEHCCVMAGYVWKLNRDKTTVLKALMHDASEAYLCDIPAPIKPYLNNYHELEHVVQTAIQAKFGFDVPCKLIKDLDRRIVTDEALSLFSSHPDWVNPSDAIGVNIEGWGWEKAERNFLNWFEFSHTCGSEV